MDSTDIPTYSNRYRKPCSDPDAKWGYKEKAVNEKYKWLGYKLHLAADTKYQIPLIPIVTPANLNDSPLMIPLVEKNMDAVDILEPKFILGDKGYDAKENYRSIVEDFDAVPIIDLNLRSQKGKPNRFEDIADEYGTPYCAFRIPMELESYNEREKRLRYRCPLAVGKPGCTWLDKCAPSVKDIEVPVWLKDDYRRFIAVPRHTKRWRKLYNKRTAVERVFSRLKKDGDGKLVNHRMRGLDKITLNCLLSVWVIQAKHVSKY